MCLFSAPGLTWPGLPWPGLTLAAFGHLLGPLGRPRVGPSIAKGASGDAKGIQGGPKGVPNGPKGGARKRPNRPKRVSNGVPKGLQGVPKAAQGRPKPATKPLKAAPRPPRGPEMEPSSYKNCPQRAHEGSHEGESWDPRTPRDPTRWPKTSPGQPRKHKKQDDCCVVVVDVFVSKGASGMRGAGKLLSFLVF